MIKINEMVKNDMLISENTEITGMVNGNIVVNENITLNISGIVTGKINLSERSRVNVYGIIRGDINNHHGFVDVYGMVNGNIHNYERGTCSISINGKVAGLVIEE